MNLIRRLERLEHEHRRVNEQHLFSQMVVVMRQYPGQPVEEAPHETYIRVPGRGLVLSEKYVPPEPGAKTYIDIDFDRV